MLGASELKVTWDVIKQEIFGLPEDILGDEETDGEEIVFNVFIREIYQGEDGYNEAVRTKKRKKRDLEEEYEENECKYEFRK